MAKKISIKGIFNGSWDEILILNGGNSYTCEKSSDYEYLLTSNTNQCWVFLLQPCTVTAEQISFFVLLFDVRFLDLGASAVNF